LPDALFREAKAVAALRGSSMKELTIHVVEREVTAIALPGMRRRIKLPIIQSPSGRKVDVTNFDFDELLG